MPGNPEQCRLYAARCLKLAERANNTARRENLAALAETWTKLAAEYEADQPLLNTLSEINLDEALYAVPEALNIRASFHRNALRSPNSSKY
jgi:cobalamin biosynthesis Mg chelatase CobN